MRRKKEGLFKYFFKPRPIITGFAESKPKWDFKPIVQVPGIKLTESVRPNSLLDATFLSSAGGGITLQKSIQKNDKNYAVFSWSPAIFLVSGNTAKDTPFDISYCTTIGFFDNLFQIGVGYDLGTVVNRSRFFGVISCGINLTNNK